MVTWPMTSCDPKTPRSQGVDSKLFEALRLHSRAHVKICDHAFIYLAPSEIRNLKDFITYKL